ncbi:MAG: Ser-Thr-rich GPI-anchored membrane family protein [Candidatus Stygibacter frigidus]|nr:Ser-Thr-rich GPI-anchored membrane family protein [Candidatus Stygibacter frigidus]
MKKIIIILLFVLLIIMGCEEKSTEPENESPNVPENPYPVNGSSNVSVNANLSWSCNDPDGDALTYDVYIGNDPTPDSGELASSDQSSTNYNPGVLQSEKTYYWKIVASDGELEIASPIWNFTTVSGMNLVIISPNGGEIFHPGYPEGTIAFIEWDDNINENVAISLYKNNEQVIVISDSTPSDGYFQWSMHAASIDNSLRYRLKICSVENDQIYDFSDSYFTITCIDFHDPGWDESIDNDNDGYYSARVMFISVINHSNSLYNIIVKILYKLENTDIFQDYYEFSETIEGNDSFYRLIWIGDGGASFSLPHNIYDFKLVIIDNSTTQNISELTYSNISELGDCKFELQAEDNINNPPVEPYYPNPTDNADNVPINTNISWSCSDPDGDMLTYDIYFGTDPTPDSGELVSSNQSETSCNLETLNQDTNYYWKIVAHDDHSNFTTGDIWQFKTEGNANQPPNPPSNPSPANNTTSISLNTNLSWDCSDPDNDPLIYDVYFGTDPSPDAGELLSTNQDNTTYNPGTMYEETTYYWKIVAKDDHSNSATSDIWEFVTINSSADYINITIPNGNEVWEAGTTQNIIWNDNIDENVLIELYLINSYHSIISNGTNSDGSFSWEIPSDLLPGSGYYKIKISNLENNTINDFSDNYFTINNIAPYITVISPNGGESWEMGTFQEITWDSNVIWNLSIILRPESNPGEIIAESIANDGSYIWELPLDLDEGNYQIQIAVPPEYEISDYSNSYFYISEPEEIWELTNFPTELIDVWFYNDIPAIEIKWINSEEVYAIDDFIETCGTYIVIDSYILNSNYKIISQNHDNDLYYVYFFEEICLPSMLGIKVGEFSSLEEAQEAGTENPVWFHYLESY